MAAGNHSKNWEHDLFGCCADPVGGEAAAIACAVSSTHVLRIQHSRAATSLTMHFCVSKSCVCMHEISVSIVCGTVQNTALLDRRALLAEASYTQR